MCPALGPRISPWSKDLRGNWPTFKGWVIENKVSPYYHNHVIDFRCSSLNITVHVEMLGHYKMSVRRDALGDIKPTKQILIKKKEGYIAISANIINPVSPNYIKVMVLKIVLWKTCLKIIKIFLKTTSRNNGIMSTDISVYINRHIWVRVVLYFIFYSYISIISADIQDTQFTPAEKRRPEKESCSIIYVNPYSLTAITILAMVNLDIIFF